MSLSIGLVRQFSENFFLKNFIQGDFIYINEALQSHGLPLYTEPPASVVKGVDFPEVTWSYSTIHYLRYIAAKFIEDPTWIADESSSQKYKIPAKLRDKIYQERRSHLICHSDFDGYYVPIDFETVIFDQRSGGWLGSSVRLRKELEELAEKLKIDLGEYTPNLSRLLALREQELKEDILKHQKWTLLCLYNIATASVRYSSAIYFS